MTLRRLVKRPKITNFQMLLMRRREPYKPTMKDRHEIENREKLERFETKAAEGIMFVPDRVLPPWQKSLAKNAYANASRMNFRGFRVRVADKQDEPGFPTPFR
ncbi:hypothetical protein C3747_85g935c [Trypanosoma cruzi]|uniref:Uncharacterized protein n=2 Tax=Trypanosoma cruzi TaxID=5693 RepID=Q4DXV3_TRYCC|nr:hypothetical protein, conserved [Trypanosoma cruzi]EAN97333.1 hypothetical protein, conserved [Trypanosoma cruzi]KAF8281695.1 putative LSU ribosomal protein, mitochondrial [Trypanosoma cruzi]PWV08807.1 hypothetical protein C3747_85g935c [Trypanosoma cruzi]RNC60311.1 hypothetical protein TcCL_ESM01950 [Trypanosoma cruzi]|eukprot:XP_819184.1 hypothetical protein [Trypanosoma cruzi strain CL Brener]